MRTGNRVLPAVAASFCLVSIASGQGRSPGEPPTTLPAEREHTQALRLSPAMEVANAYGFAEWDQVEQIEFTFNAKLPNREEPVTRQWTWRPKERRVTRGSGPDAVTFTTPVRGDGQPAAAVEADKQFVNDSYWLLFPFQLVWSNPQLTEHGEATLPIGEGTATKLTVQYPDQGGYTPGDAYDLYLDDDHRIVQWVYRKGGAPADEGRPATWEGNVDLGPIIVSTEHRGPDAPGGGFRLWFSGVKVTVRDAQGQTAVHEPAPVEE